MIKISVNEFGGYQVDESYGRVNDNGEIYILAGEDLAIKFVSDSHYHLYDQSVDSVITKLEQS